VSRDRVLYAGNDATVSGDYAFQGTPAARDALIHIADRTAHRQDYVQYRSFEHLVPTFKSVASARRAAESSRADARYFLQVWGEGLLPPAVTPTGDGGVQLEWFHQGVGVELQFDPDGDLVVLVDNDGVVESEVVTGLRDPFLLNALSLIRS
jgi:hypothetical protein